MVLTFINILGHTQPLLCSQWLQFLFEGQRSKKPWQRNSVGSLQPTPPPSVHLGSGAVKIYSTPAMGCGGPAHGRANYPSASYWECSNLQVRAPSGWDVTL